MKSFLQKRLSSRLRRAFSRGADAVPAAEQTADAERDAAEATQTREFRPVAASDLQRLVDLPQARKLGPDARAGRAVDAHAGIDAADTEKLDAWLSLALEERPTPGERLVRATRWLLALATAAGLVAGVGFMAALVTHDDAGRVNVLWILGIILLQFLLFLSALGFLLGRAQRLPLLSELVGHLPSFLYRGPLRGLLDAPWQPISPIARLHTPFLLRLTQRFALAFAATALVTLLFQVVFRDIAFGWSTTLDTTPETLQRLVERVALPWRFWLPQAVPSMELVEATQFHRLGEPGAVADPALPGRWWSFLGMCWLVYAVLPRWLLLRLSRRRWHRACHRTLHALPEYEQTLERLRFRHEDAAREAAAVIAETLARMLSHREYMTFEGGRPDKETVQALESMWRNHLQRHERDGQRQLAWIYRQAPPDVQTDSDLPDPRELFRVEDWKKWGMSRRQLSALGAAAGFTVGGAMDAGTGFLSMGAATAVGTVLGTVSPLVARRAAWIEQDQSRLVFGPVRDKQLAFAMLGRAFKYWAVCAERIPGGRPRVLPSHDWQDHVSGRQNRRLYTALRDCARGASPDEGEGLKEELVELLVHAVGRMQDSSTEGAEDS